MTKQEKIKEAYGEYWELVKETVNENGWFDYNYEEHRKIADNIPLESYSQFSSSVVRPKSLQGIHMDSVKKLDGYQLIIKPQPSIY